MRRDPSSVKCYERSRFDILVEHVVVIHSDGLTGRIFNGVVTSPHPKAERAIDMRSQEKLAALAEGADRMHEMPPDREVLMYRWQ